MITNTSITTWAMMDFIRHFSAAIERNSSNWDIGAKAGRLMVYDYDVGIRFEFAGDGIIYAERDGKRYDFDHHSHGNMGTGAFWAWLGRRFPDVAGMV